MPQNATGESREGDALGRTTMTQYPTDAKKQMPSAHRLQSSWSAPSSVDPGDPSVHVHACEEPRVVDGELDNQPVGLDHGLNSLESSNHST